MNRTPPTARSGLIPCLVIAILLSLQACTVRLISDYDEPTFTRVTQLQEQCEALFVALEEATHTADPADDLYPAHAQEYSRIMVSLRVLRTRAATLDKNEITTELVDHLIDSTSKMQATHRSLSSANPPRGFSEDTLKALYNPFSTHFSSILTLQEALKR